MWPFWMLFFIPAFGVLLGRRLQAPLQLVVWAAVTILFSVVIGLRDQVGGDWGTYLKQFSYVGNMDFSGAFHFNDPGYYVLNWWVAKSGGDIHFANLVCACCVMAGVVTFARKQPMPWLALLVAVPYLIIVVAMGYTRQSVALGFVMIGLAALAEQKLMRFVFWVLVGAFFHKSAVLLLPIAALAASKHKIWSLFWVVAVTAVGAWQLLASAGEGMWTTYVQDQMTSYGGPIRVVMNALPAILLLSLSRRLDLTPEERKLWKWMAVFSIACIPFVPFASTAVDRLALYFIPIQMFVFTRLAQLGSRGTTRTTIIVLVTLYYASIQFVWLNYAVHAKYWVPYHFMPIT